MVYVNDGISYRIVRFFPPFVHLLIHSFIRSLVRLRRREAKIDGSSSRQKLVDNTYELRLKRLKEELNGPTVTEIIQMHKNMWENNETRDTNKQHASNIEIIPKQMSTNFTVKSTHSTNTIPLDAAQSFDRDR